MTDGITRHGAATVQQPPPPRVALRVKAVAKRFGETTALSSCSLDLVVGEIHAIMGENGSGKSTLVKILAGVLAPDAGELAVGGLRVGRLDPPAVARRLGIATVFQEVLIVPTLSVLDNLFLGSDGLTRRGRSTRDRRTAGAAVTSRLLGAPLDLDLPAGGLTLSERQVCLIGRALLQPATVLVLDEATSALDVGVRQRLFDILRERRGAGSSVIFISHRMDEVEEVADRVTVLRSGVSVATLDRAEARPATMLALMSGGDKPDAAGRAPRTADRRDEAPHIRVSELVLRAGADSFSAQIFAGEIIGLAGLEGHGQDEFLRVLAGLVGPVTGSVQVGGQGQQIRTPGDAARARIAYVPRERKTEGIFAPLSILDNFAMPSLTADRRWGLISPARGVRRFRPYVASLAMRSARPRARITTLSGGNQQKVVMARWLATRPAVLLLNDPTRGVDHATKQDIYAQLIAAANNGIAVVMLSTEVDEHIALMDRVLVFREHSVFAELRHDQLDRRRLVANFFGRAA